MKTPIPKLDKCSVCNGTGKLIRNVGLMNVGPDFKVIRMCPACNGTGVDGATIGPQHRDIRVTHPLER